MPHNMTVTIESELWDKMKEHNEIRWSVVMKEAAKEKLRALEILKRLSKKTPLKEGEIRKISVEIGKKITSRK